MLKYIIHGVVIGLDNGNSDAKLTLGVEPWAMDKHHDRSALFLFVPPMNRPRSPGSSWSSFQWIIEGLKLCPDHRSNYISFQLVGPTLPDEATVRIGRQRKDCKLFKPLLVPKLCKNPNASRSLNFNQSHHSNQYFMIFKKYTINTSPIIII